MNKTIEIFENATQNISEAIRLLDVELPKHNGWLATFKNNEIESLKSLNENLLGTLKELNDWKQVAKSFGGDE